MKSEKQKMERMHAADLNSKKKQLDDYSKRSVKTLIFLYITSVVYAQGLCQIYISIIAST